MVAITFLTLQWTMLAHRHVSSVVNTLSDNLSPGKREYPTRRFLVIVLYLAVSITVTGNLTNAKIERAGDYALAEAAKPFLGEFGFRLIAIAAPF